MNTFKLKSGIPVILAPMKGTQVVTALILFKVGSRHENARNNGVSHFVEHLFFKGTEKRPTTLDISRELDGVGADFNAFTSKDWTGYYVKVASRHTRLAVDILEDILFHPLFDQNEIDRERGVIIEEINMYEDNPMVTAEEMVEELLYGKHHPLGYRIAGPKENIQRMSRQEIIAYRDEHYHPGNMVVLLAGNLPKNIKQLVWKYFSEIPKRKQKTPIYKKFEFTQKAPRILVHKKNTAQAHLALSFPGPTHLSKQLVVANVLSTVLGGSMSSRLFIHVRERQGLCYYIRSSVNPYEDMGAITIQAGFDKTRIHQAILAIIEQLKFMRSSFVSSEELQRAKEFLIGKMSLRFEDSENVASWLGSQALFHKKIKMVTDIEKEIQSVTAQQIIQLAKKIFVSSNSNLAIIGPFQKQQQKSFEKHLQF
ncbi:MAG TPA: pitrilysin family protein [Patescibacteria group bacterium]|nr:pitrilysin family protein [Patescibacteria group bacterium]